MKLVSSVPEVNRFVRWLPPLEVDQGYLLVCMSRTKALKRIMGFKGHDHMVCYDIVYGKYNSKVRFGEEDWEEWRFRLKEKILNAGSLLGTGKFYYYRHDPKSGGRNVDVTVIPNEAFAMYLLLNPTNIVGAEKQLLLTLGERLLYMSPRNMAEIPVLEKLWVSTLMKNTDNIFVTIDVDSKVLSDIIYDVVKTKLGFNPPYITTRRGIHILINLREIRNRRLTNLWYGPLDKRIVKLLSSLSDGKRKMLVEDYISNNELPLYPRLKVAEKYYKGELGQPLVEVKENPLEPVPGTVYKGVTVRFIEKP